MKIKPTRRKALEMISRAFFVFCISVFSWGCAKSIPEGKDAIDAVDIQGAPKRTKGMLLDGLATQATPKFLGIGGVYEYSTLDEKQLERDILRIERELRRRGYYQAKVRATRIIHTKEQHLRVEIEIDPGEPIIIRKLETAGLAQLPFDAAQRAVQENELRVGRIFNENEYEEAQQDVANALADDGYAYASVTGKARIDLAAHSAAVKITARPGPRCTLGDIVIEGLKDLDEKAVRRILGLKTGQRYSRAELQQARATLFQRGVFSRAEIRPDLRNPEVTEVPLTIRVEESAFRDITLGAGARLDLLRLAVVGQGSWTHRNFLGGLRKFTFTTKPGVTFFPTSIDNLRAPTAAFPENFATVRLEQPALFEARTKGFVEAGYNVYPLLYPLPKDTGAKDENGVPIDVLPQEERVVGYSEIITSVGVERSFLRERIPTTFSLNLQSNTPFDYQTPQCQFEDDPNCTFADIAPVLITYPELMTSIDLRDDPVQPTMGALISNSLQVAIPVGNSPVSDLRINPEIRTFVPLDRHHRVILATRAGVGMVLANNYAQNYGTGGTIDYRDEGVINDQHKLLFRGFYSGGPGSNRGYPFNRIGPQGPIGFLIPNGVTCDEFFAGTNLDSISPACIRPLGGLTMWEASTELRYRAFEKWVFVGFVDASDVDTQRATFTFYEPHISAGAGIRYLSPVGPIRVDLGYRVPGLQTLRDNPNQPPDVSQVPPYNRLGNRFALHILIGEDF